MSYTNERNIMPLNYREGSETDNPSKAGVIGRRIFGWVFLLGGFSQLITGLIFMSPPAFIGCLIFVVIGGALLKDANKMAKALEQPTDIDA